MALDDLQAVIKSLQNKIEQHYAYLSSSETRTRQVLIDPLLKELGWDVSDPDQVELEYSAGGGRADYALMSEGKPVAVIEAKRLGYRLDQSETMQVLNYANSRGIAHMAVTNGDEWRMYDVFAQKAIEERVIMEFSITRTPAHESALQSLRIWNPNLSSAHGPVGASESIVKRLDPPPIVGPCPPPEVPGPEVGWIPLTSVSGLNKNSPMPEEIKFPDGSNAETIYGVDLLRQTVKWLVDTGKLNSTHPPVTRSGGTSSRYIWNRQPEHSNGRPFNNPEKIGDGVWVEKDLTSQQAVDNATLLLGNYGVNANEVQVKLHTA